MTTRGIPWFALEWYIPKYIQYIRENVCTVHVEEDESMHIYTCIYRHCVHVDGVETSRNASVIQTIISLFTANLPHR